MSSMKICRSWRRSRSGLLSLAHHSGTDTEKWAPVANRLRVVLAELRGLEELSGGTVEHGARTMADRMRNLQKLLNKRRTALETALAGKPGAELLAPTMELSQAITDASQQALEHGARCCGRTWSTCCESNGARGGGVVLQFRAIAAGEPAAAAQ